MAKYGVVLDAMRPGCVGVERRLRCGVLYLRDRAAAAGERAGWEAATVLAAINSIATVHAFASMPFDQLDTLHRSLTRMMLSAMALETRGPGSDAHVA